MSFPRLWLSIVVFALLATAAPADADGVYSPEYSITGIVLLTGNNTCAPAPCTESIAFFFDLGYAADSPLGSPTQYFAEVSDAMINWSGDMASLMENVPNIPVGIPYNPGPGCDPSDENTIPFLDSPGGDEVDLHLCENGTPTPVVPELAFADLYACRTTACSTDFSSNPNPFEEGILEDVTVSQLPEM